MYPTLSKLKHFDAYPKTLEDFRIKTFGGAAGKEILLFQLKVFTYNKIIIIIIFLFLVTITSVTIMILLFLMELNEFLKTEISEQIFVDTSRGSKLKINLDVIIPSISCDCMYMYIYLFLIILSISDI